MYKGITTKKFKDGTKNIMVRFQYKGKIYPLKNFTKLFGCTTEEESYKKLSELKLMISVGIDPFKIKRDIEENYNKNMKGILYYIKIEYNNRYYWKIGITNRSVEKRFTNKDLDKFIQIKQWIFKNGKLPYLIEQTILEKWNKYKYMGTEKEMLSKEKILENGNTEIFKKDIISEIETLMSIYEE